MAGFLFTKALLEEVFNKKKEFTTKVHIDHKEGVLQPTFGEKSLKNGKFAGRVP